MVVLLKIRTVELKTLHRTPEGNSDTLSLAYHLPTSRCSVSPARSTVSSHKWRGNNSVVILTVLGD
jgi:hypothetical protein